MLESLQTMKPHSPESSDISDEDFGDVDESIIVGTKSARTTNCGGSEIKEP